MIFSLFKEGIWCNVLNTKKIKSGVYFHSFVDKKFKFNRISVNFVVKMDSKEVSQNAILSSHSDATIHLSKGFDVYLFLLIVLS